MVVIQYFVGKDRVGMLAWRHVEGKPAAMGGFEPPFATQPDDGLTVVTTDDGERCFLSLVHPDALSEVSGVDGFGLRLAQYVHFGEEWCGGNIPAGYKRGEGGYFHVFRRWRHGGDLVRPYHTLGEGETWNSVSYRVAEIPGVGEVALD